MKGPIDATARGVAVVSLSLLTAICAMGSGGRTSVEIPFELYRNQIIVQIEIDGTGPFHMLLDTGTDPSTIDLATARSIGLKVNSKGQPVSGGGADANLGYVTKLPLVTLGSLSARNVSAIAIDLSKLSAQLGRHTDGVLGHSLLNGRTVQIDYAGRMLRFYDKALLSEASIQTGAADRALLRFRYDGAILIDDTFVNGQRVTANLDTGSNETFSLTPAITSFLGLEDVAQRGKPAPSVGYNGVSENRRNEVQSLRIGPLTFDSPTVTFFPKLSGHDQEIWGLNIGNVFLKDFILTIDYRSHLVLLEKP